MKTTLYLRVFNFILLCLLLSVGARAQYGADLGPRAVSSLAWDHISFANYAASGTLICNMGLTTDKRMYVWGENLLYSIHTQGTKNGTTNVLPLQQTTPFYVPSPAGETIKKVQVKATASTAATGDLAATYFCMSESGKLYAWGYNNGLLATTWPVPTGSPTNTLADTARTRRTPTQLTILTESTFVDFDVSTNENYWIAIGASGKAYHIGHNGGISGGGIDYQYTFAALPNPAGVDNATFKYTKVWVGKEKTSLPVAYLKGNDGKLYYTGFIGAYISGIPSLFPRNTPAPTLTTNETRGNIRSIVPKEVPSLAGVDIVKMEIGNPQYDRQTTCAVSADGKAYMTGLWRVRSRFDNSPLRNFVIVPIKANPVSTDIEVLVGAQDTSFVLKRFVEVATPPGATKIIDILLHDKTLTNGDGNGNGSIVVGDNNKVFWSGSLNTSYLSATVLTGNYLSLVPNLFSTSFDKCVSVLASSVLTPYTWSQESVNYEGASKLPAISNFGVRRVMCIISKTGRGYYVGDINAANGVGKIENGNGGSLLFYSFPVPIANEQLLSCQTSPGTGGPLTASNAPTNTAVGTIDCSKTQIAPAPVAGTPSQTTLIVSVNVTTAGTFTPITVSGSGMSLGNGIMSVTTASTGVRTFYIPIQYDGSALTNALQFTIGSAGSCTADLTKTPVKAITDVWSLECLPSVGPALKK